MKCSLALLCLLESVLQTVTGCTVPPSEFHLKGDYMVGGLFNVHHDGNPVHYVRPEAIECSSQEFLLSSYRRFQLMRFAVEEINNSTDLLPNVSLGYDIFDHCSDSHSFPGILSFISVNSSIRPYDNLSRMSEVIAVVGTFTSPGSRTVAPLFMMDLIPMVSYGASSSIFSRKQNFPSFLRMMHPNKDVIESIYKMLVHFNWRWVAFLNINDDYGNDGRDVFIEMIEGTDICLAYTRGLDEKTNYTPIFKQLETQQINIIIVYAPEWTAEDLIMSAIEQNVTNKVWIAGDAWALNKRLPKLKGIKNIGTVLGVSEPKITIPGFNDFIYSSKGQSDNNNEEQQKLCNQVCNCSGLRPENITSAESSFSFAVYSAIYAIAHALHNTLQCGSGECNRNITPYPHVILKELKKSNFTLLNHSIQFDDNGDPTFGYFSFVFWNQSGDAEEVGFYKFDPLCDFFVNNSKIQWYENKPVPSSLCSIPCDEGYKKKTDGPHKCCFKCEICPEGTYVNTTEDPYLCIKCNDKTEWSSEGSTKCNHRVEEYVHFTETAAIFVMIGTWAFIGFTVAVSVLFAINYNTPVVKSAGGPMCFLILSCLILCSISVFFYFGVPTDSFCVLRYVPFLLFYTVCVACFVVRSFQIVFIFKIAAKYPKFHSLWVKYNGQWLFITAVFLIQLLLIVFVYSFAPPKAYSITSGYFDKLVLDCHVSLNKSSVSLVFLSLLCLLCFIFSYMGKDLPKNYNEAKSITFCLLLLILTWVVFATIFFVYSGKHIQTLNALAVLCSLYSFLVWYFMPKVYIIIYQPQKNTQQYFQDLILNYSKAITY
ncbi:taste receptor type 1 member 2-like [Sphaeramia orbicularis]|uniref:taste receptor type 1 member 2-like n=1 Tax=Sphaeramia orbicularis TaxID=375764 RepID=UPI0011802ABC|nr:taste receptor type 1 member 2-like [Sphaeramia orbicularis]